MEAHGDVPMGSGFFRVPQEEEQDFQGWAKLPLAEVDEPGGTYSGWRAVSCHPSLVSVNPGGQCGHLGRWVQSHKHHTISGAARNVRFAYQISHF